MDIYDYETNTIYSEEQREKMKFFYTWTAEYSLNNSLLHQGATLKIF